MSSSVQLLLEAGAHLAQRQILVDPVGAGLAHRHDLDQRHVHAAAMRPFDQRGDLVLIVLAQRHRIDLHMQASALGGVDAGEHLLQVAPAGQSAEALLVQRVERDVQPLHAAGGELIGEAGELRAIGGQRQLFQRPGLQVPAERAEQRHHVPAHQGLRRR